MYKELFNGYNCLSAALGEYSIRKKYNYIKEPYNSAGKGVGKLRD